MARVSVTIPNRDWIVIPGFYMWWNPSFGRYVDLGGTLVDGDGSAFLASLRIPLTASESIEVTLASTQNESKGAVGPDFLAELETNGTITFTDSADNSVVIQGIDDSAEPYFWKPDNINDLVTWATAFLALGNRSLTVAFDDGSALAAPAVADQQGRRGSAFSYQLPVATGGIGPYTYTVSGLPAGLNFTPGTRTIAGTPTATGTATVTYTATDSDSPTPASASVMFDIEVLAPLPVSLPSVANQSGVRGSAVSVQLPVASGGIGPYTYSVSGLPAGLTFNAASRTISGTPTTTQSATVTYTATDSDSPTAATGNRTFTFTIADPPPPALAVVPDATGRRGTAFSVTCPAATAGVGPYTYTVSGLPAGLAFDDDTRVISGFPTAEGAFTVTYTATDSDTPARSASRTFTITIAAPVALSLPAATNQTGRRGSAFSYQLPVATGGIGPYTYTVSGLPAGLNFTPGTRTIAGTPTATGTATVTYTATDSDSPTPASASRTFDIAIADLPAPALPAVTDQTGQNGVAFSEQLPPATAGVPPYTYSVTGLAGGLTFDAATRTISGTPSVTRTTTYTVTYTATDSDTPARSASRTFEIEVAGPLALERPTSLRVANGSRTTVRLPAATGGTPPYTYTATGLPAGLTFTANTRILTGILTADGSSNVSYRVTDAANVSVVQVFTITVVTVPDNAIYRLEVDWDGDGTFAHSLSNVWDDLVSLRAQRGRNFREMVYGRSVAGHLQARLRNDTGRYSRFNSESVLFKLVVPGKRVRLRMRASRSASYVTIWGGQLFSIDGDPRASGDDRVTLTAYGPLADLTQREISVPMQSGVRHPLPGAATYDPPNAHKTRAFPAGITAQGFAFDGTRYISVSGRNVHAFHALNEVGNPLLLGRLPNGGDRGGLTYRPDRDVLVSVNGNNIEVFTAANPSQATARAIGATGGQPFVGICWDGDRYVLVRQDRTVWHFTDETDPDDDIAMGGTLSTALAGGNTLTGGIDWDGTQYVVGAGDSPRRLILFTSRNNPGDAVSAGEFAADRTWEDGDVCWDGSRIIVGRLEDGTARVQGGMVNLYAMAVVPPARFQTAESTITTSAAAKLVLDAALVPEWQRGTLRGSRSMSRWWVSRQRTIDALRALEETESGILYETKDGRIAMDAENSRVGARSQYILNADGVGDIPVVSANPHDPVKDVVNIVQVPVRSYEVGLIEVIWQASSVVEIQRGQSVAFIAEYPPPSNPAGSVGIDEWIPLAAGIDYTANALAVGTGTDRTGDVSIIVQDTASSRVMTVSNTSSTSLFITRLQTRGRVLTETAPIVVEERDGPSIREFQPRTYLAPAQFISTVEDAQSYALVLLDSLKSPPIRLDTTLEMSDHLVAAQSLDVSHKVTFVSKGRRDDMFVESVEHSIERGGRHHVTLLLGANTFVSNVFILGQSRLGEGALGR